MRDFLRWLRTAMHTDPEVQLAVAVAAGTVAMMIHHLLVKPLACLVSELEGDPRRCSR